jgi:hypothetical protein
MNAVVSAQFSYHVRMAAMCAIAGNTEESATESVLAWSMLSSCCGGAAAGAADVGFELIDPDRVAATADQSRRAQTRAHDLALSLEAHFVSTGQHEQATLYETVADELEASIAALVHWRSVATRAVRATTPLRQRHPVGTSSPVPNPSRPRTMLLAGAAPPVSSRTRTTSWRAGALSRPHPGRLRNCDRRC